MSSNQKKLSTRQEAKKAGVSLSWNKKLGDKTIIESGPVDTETDALNSEAGTLETVEVQRETETGKSSKR